MALRWSTVASQTGVWYQKRLIFPACTDAMQKLASGSQEQVREVLHRKLWPVAGNIDLPRARHLEQSLLSLQASGAEALYVCWPCGNGKSPRSSLVGLKVVRKSKDVPSFRQTPLLPQTQLRPREEFCSMNIPQILQLGAPGPTQVATTSRSQKK